MNEVWTSDCGRATLYCGDCLEVLPGLADSSVSLVATDPPYFKVKSDAWDRQWDKPEEFLEWLGRCVKEWARVMAPNGSLYCFASPQMRARVEIEVSRWLACLPTITWVKADKGGNGQWKKQAPDGWLRCFFPQTEGIIFAEHYGADNIAKGEAGYGAKCDKLRGFVFEPLRAYLAGERERAGIDKADCNVACGFSRSAGGMASRHYFSRSQWCLPTREHYQALRDLFNRNGGDYLRREYDYLRREYEDLRREYEDLRRPFSVSADVPYTDVWTFPTVQGYAGKHPCEKPIEMMAHIITASSRPDGVVLDSFMVGSGTTGVAAIQAGRRFIGIEQDPDWFEVAKARVSEALNELPLFAESVQQ